MSFIPGTPIFPKDVLGLELASGNFAFGVLTLVMMNGSVVTVPVVLGPTDIAAALGGPGVSGQVVGTDGTTPQWVTLSSTPPIQTHGVVANATIGTLPAGAMISGITVTETAGNPVTFFLGTTLGAQDVLGPVPLGANQMVPISPLSLTTWAWQAPEILYIGSASWGGASLNVKLVFT
jgi:hypothetical protein